MPKKELGGDSVLLLDLAAGASRQLVSTLPPFSP